MPVVRRATSADSPAIERIHAAAFARDDGTTPVEPRLFAALLAAGDVVPELSLVAEVDGNVVGHVVCSRAHLGERPSLGLGPIGVLPQHQAAGIGGALMHAVIGAAEALGHSEVVLLGDPGYYRRFGFELAVPLEVLPPDPEWARYFQIRTLSAWRPTRGAFRYAAAFDDL